MGLGLASASAQLVLVNNDFSGPETPNQLGYYTAVGSAPITSDKTWSRFNTRLQNPGAALNTVLWKSFDDVTLQNVGDWITLSVEAGFTSVVTSGDGLVVGLFDRTQPMTDNVVAGNNVESGAGDSGYVFRQFSTSNIGSLNAATVRTDGSFPGRALARTGTVETTGLSGLVQSDGAVRPITITMTLTSTGLMVTGTQNGVEMNSSFFEGVTSFNANSVLIMAQANTGAGYIESVNVTAIPEPSTYALIFGALIGVIAWIRRKRMS